jgi:hypothetical protein
MTHNEMQQLSHVTKKRLKRLNIQMRKTKDEATWLGLAELHAVLTNELSKLKESLKCNN